MYRRTFLGSAAVLALIPRFAVAQTAVAWQHNAQLTKLSPQTSGPVAAAYFDNKLHMVYAAKSKSNLWWATMGIGATQLGTNQKLVSNIGPVLGGAPALAAGPKALYMVHLNDGIVFSIFDGTQWRSAQTLLSASPPQPLSAPVPPSYIAPSLALIGNTLHMVIRAEFLTSCLKASCSGPSGFYHASVDISSDALFWSPLTQLTLPDNIQDCVAVNLGGHLALASQDSDNHINVGYLLNGVYAPTIIIDAGTASPPRVDLDNRRIAATAGENAIYIAYVGYGQGQLYWLCVRTDLTAFGNQQVVAAGKHARTGISPTITIAGTNVSLPYKGDDSDNIWLATGSLS